MRKWLYFLLVVIVAGFLSGAYYVTGIKAEKEFNHLIKSVNTTPNLKVFAENYQRGWFKSTVHLHVILNVPPQQYLQNGMMQTLPTRRVSFSFDMNLYHGPIIFEKGSVVFGLGGAEAKVPLPDEILNQFNQVFTPSSIKPNFIISLLLHYGGKLAIDLDIPPFMLISNDNQSQIDWKGFNGNWKISRKLARIKGNVLFHGLTFKLNASNGSVGPTSLKYNVKNRGDDLLSGDASLGLESFTLSGNGVLPFIINGFQAVSDSDIKTNNDIQLINSSLKADVKKVTYQGFDYGPGVLDIDILNLDAHALGQIETKLQTVSNENLTDAQQQIFLLTLLPEISRLLEQGAELHVKQFQLAIPQGLILATAKVKLPVQQKGNQNPFQLIPKIHAYLTAEVPVLWLTERLTDFLQFKIEQRQLIEKQISEKGTTETTDRTNEASSEDKSTHVPTQLLSPKEITVLAKQQALEQLQTLVQNGILIQQQNVYQIKLMFKSGRFYVNGKPFNNKQIEGVNNDSAN